jgi:hypothetical protein
LCPRFQDNAVDLLTGQLELLGERELHNRQFLLGNIVVCPGDLDQQCGGGQSDHPLRIFGGVVLAADAV